MTSVVHLTDAFAVSPQIAVGDVQRLAALGFRAIVGVRPDEEAGDGHETADEIAAMAEAHGLVFRYVPAGSHDVTETETVNRFEAALRGLDGPVLAYCKSGTRAAIVWALAAARYHPPGCVGLALSKAGVDPELIEDELRGQRRKRGKRPSSLAVRCPDIEASTSG